MAAGRTAHGMCLLLCGRRECLPSSEPGAEEAEPQEGLTARFSGTADGGGADGTWNVPATLRTADGVCLLSSEPGAEEAEPQEGLPVGVSFSQIVALMAPSRIS